MKIMKSFEKGEDFYYDNGTLKNKFHILDAKTLKIFEYRNVAVHSIWLLEHTRPKIETLQDLQKVHFFLFRKVYDWAGQIRNYDISKDQTDFLPYSVIPTAIKNINTSLKKMNKKDKLSTQDYAFLLDRINFLHPFREGNGRTTKLFLQMLGLNHNQMLDYSRQNNQVIQSLEHSNVERLTNFIKLENIINRQNAIDVLIKQQHQQLKLLKKRKRHKLSR